MTFGGRQTLVEDKLWWQTTLGGKLHWVEDTLGGRRILVEDDLWWKMPDVGYVYTFFVKEKVHSEMKII